MDKDRLETQIRRAQEEERCERANWVRLLLRANQNPNRSRRPATKARTTQEIVDAIGPDTLTISELASATRLHSTTIWRSLMDLRSDGLVSLEEKWLATTGRQTPAYRLEAPAYVFYLCPLCGRRLRAVMSATGAYRTRRHRSSRDRSAPECGVPTGLCPFPITLPYVKDRRQTELLQQITARLAEKQAERSQAPPSIHPSATPHPDRRGLSRGQIRAARLRQMHDEYKARLAEDLARDVRETAAQRVARSKPSDPAPPRRAPRAPTARAVSAATIEAVASALIDRPDSTAMQISALVGRGDQHIREALKTLEAKGVVEKIRANPEPNGEWRLPRGARPWLYSLAPPGDISDSARPEHPYAQAAQPGPETTRLNANQQACGTES